jgi:hypothetical protein
MVFTLEQRILIVEHYIMSRSYETTAREFEETYGAETPAPNKSSIKRVYDKFKKTGKVADAPRIGRPPVLTEEKVTDIHDAVLKSLKKSVRRPSSQSGVSVGSAHKALKDH